VTDGTVTVVRLRTGDDSGLIATSAARPTLSWSLASDRAEVRQRSYEIEVAADPSFADAVSSGELESDVVVDHDWPAESIRSREVRFWRVRVRTDAGWTAWSEAARVEAALLEADDWTARPVTVPSDRGRPSAGPATLVRREFDLVQAPASARLYVTALGLHRTSINGHRVGDELLAPGWTSYPNRLLYATYDVTDLLVPGRNILGAMLGDGWYRGHLSWLRRRNVYGNSTALLAQLEVTFADGTAVTIGTDEQWRGGYGDIRMADIYDGCDSDLREEAIGWPIVGFDDSAWERVETLPLPTGLAQRGHPPVRELLTLTPERTTLSNGTIALDAGQNLTGWLRIQATGPAGATVRVRHAEVLDDEGRLFTTLLRTARAMDTYVLAGDEAELEPDFTFHGFRYAEIEASAGVTVNDVQVVVVASDLRRIGEFTCSDERVNRLYSNVIWSQRGNFLSVPTDCPQRDERLGWTGDIMAFAPTAAANFDSRAFLDSWLTDVALEQLPSGGVPMVVPNCLVSDGMPPMPLPMADGVAGWADAVTVVPTVLVEAYGYGSLLGPNYPTMRRWVDYVEGLLDADGTWSGYMQLGDWLDPNAPPDEPFKAITDSGYVATCFVAHSARLLAETARRLGQDAVSERYAALGDRTAHAAWKKWQEHARTTQTGCALAIEFGIAPVDEHANLGDTLAELVRANDGKIGTGFLGTPFVLPALTSTGHVAEAYQLLLNEKCPGWLYEVQLGATTTWERWDGILPDGRINGGEIAVGESDTMSSFNHYANGAVASWLYRSLAGLAPAAPGYREVRIAPQPGGDLTSASAAIDTEYGIASVGWSIEGPSLTLDVVLPAGTTGHVAVPVGWASELPLPNLGSGPHRIRLTRES
jgi:alpha-L-rhamnosidase